MIVVVANPNAGYLKRRTQADGVDKLRQVLGSHGQLLLTHNTEALLVELQRLNPQDIRALVPFGGDGTVSAVIGAAAKVWGEQHLPPLFLVHAGTMNMIAADVHPKTAPIDALQWLIAHRDQLEHHHTTRYPIKTSTDQYGFVFGFGTTVNFMHAYYQRGSGPVAALRLIGRIVLEVLVNGPLIRALFATVAGRVRFNGQAAQGFMWQVALALSILRLPLGAKVSTSGGPKAKADLCLIHGSPNKLALVFNLWRIWRGGWPASLGVPRQTLHSVEFDFNQPTAWQLDGDIQAPIEGLTIAVAPAMRFISAAPHEQRA
ncbi:diacylglycerol kinase family protein [Limnobacter sp.]|uniref:diacylglycerol/lipid kinase family protein n=1 Tax=Limnobacter sp. TaxID=2003368 RepID=UPI003515F34E